jgi:O-antigen/teichoic acid export membrane protein
VSVARISALLQACFGPGLVRNAVFAIAETGITGLAVFLIYYYAAAQLGVKAIGAWSLAFALTSVSRVADIGFGNALLRFIPAALARDRKDEAVGLVETSIATIAALYLAVLLIAAPLIALALRAAVESAEQPLVFGILPYVLLSFWLSNVGGVLLCALAGVHRYDQRSVVSIIGSLVQLVATIVLVSPFGLLGLVWAQVIQNVVVTWLGWFLLRRHLPIGLMPVRFSHAHFRQMLDFGLKLQLSSIANLLFEPITKMILSSYAGLLVVGYYEMASRMVVQVRSLLVNAVQVSTPTLAGLHEQDKTVAFDVYFSTLQTTWFFAFPLMAAFAALIPAISEIWLGYRSVEFVTFALILAAAWTINLLCAPSLFMGWASGYMRGNVWGFAIVAIANLPLGIVFGAAWGGVGVVLASALALVAGSVLILVVNDRMFGGKLSAVVTLPLIGANAISLLGSAIAIYTYGPVRERFGIGGGLVASVVTVAIAIGLSGVLHPQGLRPLKAIRAKTSAALSGS